MRRPRIGGTTQSPHGRDGHFCPRHDPPSSHSTARPSPSRDRHQCSSHASTDDSRICVQGSTLIGYVRKITGIMPMSARAGGASIRRVRRFNLRAVGDGNVGRAGTASVDSSGLAVCGGPRLGHGRQIAGGFHDQYDAPALPARCDDACPAGRRLVPSAVHRAHPHLVRLPSSPLVRLVRGQHPRPAGRDPARPGGALHSAPARLWADGLLDQHHDARRPWLLPVRPHRRPDRPILPSTPACPRFTPTSPAPRGWTGWN
jgi:hypothetical protein